MFTAASEFAGPTSTYGPNSEPVHLTRWKLETSGGNSLRTLYPLHSLHTVSKIVVCKLILNLGTLS
jgi:hypothetical protein